MPEIKRSKKIVLTSFCILNQNAVIKDWERAEGAFSFVTRIIDNEIGIMQLPCPEIITKGMARKSLEYADYDTKEHRKNSRESLIPIFKQLEEFIDNQYEIVGIIGIHNSPNCSITGKRGVFMEEFFEECRRRNWDFPKLEVPDYSVQEELAEFSTQLDLFLKGRG